MGSSVLLTADEFQLMPDEEAVRTELDEGQVIGRPLLGFDNACLISEIGYFLYGHVKPNRLGKIYGTNTGFQLTDDTVRAPDLSFVRASRRDSIRSKGFAKGAPDLAVEIISPSDSIRQLMRKVKQYFAAGTHTVWIVYPDEQEVQVLEATGTDRWLKGDDPIEAPELLPGFSVPISQFFE
jgi:Uma2 family endonuclease